MLLAYVAIALGSLEPALLVPHFDVTDGVDDEPLARDLRAAFGAAVGSCDATGCHIDIVHVACERGGCRAEDAATGKALVALGRSADVLTAHLLANGSAMFVSDHTAAARITCSSGPPATGAIPHAHCAMTLHDGDPELAHGLVGFGGSKLGGVTWSGPVHADCEHGACQLECTSDGPGGYMACDGQARARRIADKPFIAALQRRLGKRETASVQADVECQTWRSQQYDGGLTDVQGCGVTR